MNKKALFIVPCNSFFPSGIVRVSHYLPYLKKENIDYRCENFYSAFSQQLLRWLNRSIFHKTKLSDFAVRVFFHLIGYPHQFYRLLQIIFLSFWYDALFLQATLFPVWYTRVLHFFYKHIVFDFDDAWYIQKEKRTIASITYADHVIAGSHALYDYAKKFNNNVQLIPSCIPMEKYEAVGSNKKDEGPLRIGWIGGNNSINQLSLLVEPLIYLLQNQYDFEFLLAGSDNLHTVLHDVPGLQIIEIPNYKDDDIPDIARSIDIGVMPLQDNVYHRGRCGYKLLIYMASGVPSISSPTGEAKYIMRNEESGLFANSKEEWISNLLRLMEDPKLRERLANNGVRNIIDNYSIQKYYEIFRTILLSN